MYWDCHLATCPYDAWTRFVQLPKDYYQPNWDCVFFEELAWAENGSMVVEAKNFSTCMAIYELKLWLAWPGKYDYPFECFGFHDDHCPCETIFSVLLTDKRLSRFFENRETDCTDENFEDWRDQMKAAASDMRNYCDKLMTGEEVISESNRALNVLSATQVFEMAEKVKSVIKCISQGLPTNNQLITTKSSNNLFENFMAHPGESALFGIYEETDSDESI